MLKEKARRERRDLVFVDESGFYLLPAVVKTYAPKGRTPILDEWQTRDHLSVMGGVTTAGPGVLAGAAEVAERAAQHRVPRPSGPTRSGIGCLVIWDGSPIHRRAEVQAFVAEAGGKIHLEPLPPYAPDLNPVEWLWRHLKKVETAQPGRAWIWSSCTSEFHLALGRVRQTASSRPIILRGSRAGAVKLYFSMQRSVSGIAPSPVQCTTAFGV